jgi:uncharacterized protein YndB with AHSA1/START domain
MAERAKTIKVSMRIEAPAEQIFKILADPQRHPEFDGSSEFTGGTRMLQGALSDDVITDAGETFAMKMYLDEVGEYVMLNYVVEFELNRRIAWEPAPGDVAASEDGKYPIGVPAGHRWGFDLIADGPGATIVTETYDGATSSDEVREATDEGEAWIATMTATLERLDAISKN